MTFHVRSDLTRPAVRHLYQTSGQTACCGDMLVDKDWLQPLWICARQGASMQNLCDHST